MWGFVNLSLLRIGNGNWRNLERVGFIHLFVGKETHVHKHRDSMWFLWLFMVCSRCLRTCLAQVEFFGQLAIGCGLDYDVVVCLVKHLMGLSAQWFTGILKAIMIIQDHSPEWNSTSKSQLVNYQAGFLLVNSNMFAQLHMRIVFNPFITFSQKSNSGSASWPRNASNP